MAEVAGAASPATTPTENPNAAVTSLAQLGTSLSLPSAKTKATSQNSSADVQLTAASLAITLPLACLVTPSPEPMSNGPSSDSEAEDATSCTQASDSSSAVPLPVGLSGSPKADNVGNRARTDVLNQFTIESPQSMSSKFDNRSQPATTDSGDSSNPLAPTPTVAEQSNPQGQTSDPNRWTQTTVAEISSGVESASGSPLSAIPEAGGAQASSASDTLIAPSSNAGGVAVVNQSPEQQGQAAIASIGPVMSQPEGETPQNGAGPVRPNVASVKVPLTVHVATGAGPSPGTNDLSVYPPKTASGSAGSSLPFPTLSATVHQAASIQNLPPVATHISNVSLASTTSFVEARGPKPSSTNAASANSASHGSSQTSSVTASSKSSQSNADGGSSSDNSQHKEATASASTPSAPSLASPSVPSSAADVSQSLPAVAAVAGGAPANPQSTSSSSVRPDAPANPHEPVLSFPPDASHAPVPPGPVQMAQMVSRAAQSEMRIGMNTSEFGSVEVRTFVHANDVGVQIGSERGDLRSLLSTEIPGIANTLQQQNLRLTQVNFHQQGFSFTGNSPGGGNPQPRSFATKSNALAPSGPEISPESNQMETPRSSGTSGLSVLA